MKEIFENWRKSVLTEKLLLKPGPGGWDLYGELVADAYVHAPDFDPNAARSFESITPFIENMFKKVQSRVEVQFVDDDPYDNDDHMRREVAGSGILKIWNGGTDHPVFDPMTNLKLRAVHDYMAHIQALGSSGTGFDMKGEIQAYNTHLKTIPPSAGPALFTEVLGQAAFFLNKGHFPKQKIAFLPGFDYHNIGAVEGYDIVAKQLVKTGPNEKTT